MLTGVSIRQLEETNEYYVVEHQGQYFNILPTKYTRYSDALLEASRSINKEIMRYAASINPYSSR